MQLTAGVTYTDRHGYRKAAFVIGTPESINPEPKPEPTEAELEVLAKFGASVPSQPAPVIAPLADGEVILAVVSPVSGRISVRRSRHDEATGTYRSVETLDKLAAQAAAAEQAAQEQAEADTLGFGSGLESGPEV